MATTPIPAPDTTGMYAITYGNYPTFYLSPAVQGITSQEHAARIASEIIGETIPADWPVLIK